MAIVFIVVTVLVVAAIGLVSVGRVTAQLEAQPPPSLFDMDEAIEFVAERLPFEVSAQLSYDDVAQIIGWQLDYLEQKGVAAPTEQQLVDEQAAGTAPLVADDDEGLAYVIGRATDAAAEDDGEIEIDDVQIVAVVVQFMDYLEAIGAVGTPVEGPLDPL